MENKKTNIRREILERRSRLGEEERKRASLLLTERIIGHQWYYLSEILLGFASYGSEIDTSGILKDALEKGKKVCLPRVMGDEICFFRIHSLEELEKGYKGIPEPSGNTECFVHDPQTAQKILMLMPGVAFDKYRNRIGYGKGYYDRYLQDKEDLQLRTIAVGFSCQMVEEIPSLEYDIRPCQVICV